MEETVADLESSFAFVFHSVEHIKTIIIVSNFLLALRLNNSTLFLHLIHNFLISGHFDLVLSILSLLLGVDIIKRVILINIFLLYLVEIYLSLIS